MHVIAEEGSRPIKAWVTKVAATTGFPDYDDAVLDEIPGAYKRLDVVMDNQRDLIEVVHTLKAVLCVKGN